MAIAEALDLCEAGEWDGIRQLREWHGGRLRLTLERMLGDEALAAQALESALDDIWRHAGAHRAMGIDAEDWLFGRLRQAAQSYRSGNQAPAHLRPVPPATAPAQTAPTPRETQAGIAFQVAEPDPDSPELVNSRIRRPSAPVQSRPFGGTPDATSPYIKRRSWLRLILLWLLAGTLGFALAATGLLWLTGTSPVPHAVEHILPNPPTEPEAQPSTAGETPEAPGRTSPSARDLIGPPLVAPEPSAGVATDALSLTPPTTRPAAPPPAPAPVTPTRVVIHFGGDADSRELAQRLADQLRRADYSTVEIRAVPFEVGSASVRFFHAEDRLAAQQLVNALGPFLVWQGRSAPTAPTDFTDYRPLPSTGSIEIWLPRR